MAGRPRSLSNDQILDATTRVLQRLGPGRLTLADVAAEVGLVPATLIQRFGSKRGLLLAHAERAAQQIGPLLRAARAEAVSPLDALIETLTAIAQSTGGGYHPASDAEELAGIAATIDLRLTVAKQDVPLAGAFSAAALALLAAGALLTVVRTGRLV